MINVEKHLRYLRDNDNNDNNDNNEPAVIPTTIGQTIRYLRHRYGLSQRELADWCGTSKSTVSKIERDELDGGFKTLDLLHYFTPEPTVIGNNVYDNQPIAIDERGNKQTATYWALNPTKTVKFWVTYTDKFIAMVKKAEDITLDPSNIRLVLNSHMEKTLGWTFGWKEKE